MHPSPSAPEARPQCNSNCGTGLRAIAAAAMMILMIAGILPFIYRLRVTTSFTRSAATADAPLDQGVVFDMSTV